MYSRLTLVLFFMLSYGCVNCRPSTVTREPSLNEQVMILEEGFREIHQQVAQQKKIIAQQNAKVLQLHLQNLQLKEQLTRLDSLQRGQMNSSFLAVNNLNQSVSPQGVVRFPTVVHSNGPEFFGYDSSLSSFRCPYNGIYVFFFNVVTNAANQMTLFTITRESDRVASSYTRTSSYQYQAAMSAMAVTPCNKGQNVYVINGAESGVAGVYGDYNGSTHFTGFLLYYA